MPGTGNEAVLAARFEDAQFFYRADLATPLEALRPRLAGTLFHKDLGTLLDKSERVERLVAPLAAAARLTGAPSLQDHSEHVWVHKCWIESGRIEGFVACGGHTQQQWQQSRC